MSVRQIIQHIVQMFNPPALAFTSCGDFIAEVAQALWKNQENIEGADILTANPM